MRSLLLALVSLLMISQSTFAQSGKSNPFGEIQKLVGKDFSQGRYSLEQQLRIAEQEVLRASLKVKGLSYYDADSLSPQDIIGRQIAGVAYDDGEKSKKGPRIFVYAGKVVRAKHHQGFFIAEVEQADGSRITVDALNPIGTASHARVYVIGQVSPSWN